MCRAASSTYHDLNSKHTAFISDTPNGKFGSLSDKSGEHYKNDEEWDRLHALLCSFNGDNYTSLQEAAGGLHHEPWFVKIPVNLIPAAPPTSTEDVLQLNSNSLQTPYPYPFNGPASNLPSLGHDQPPLGSDSPSYPNLNNYTHEFVAAPSPAVLGFMCRAGTVQKDELRSGAFSADRSKLTSGIPAGPPRSSMISGLYSFSLDAPTHNGIQDDRVPSTAVKVESSSFSPAAKSDSSATMRLSPNVSVSKLTSYTNARPESEDREGLSTPYKVIKGRAKLTKRLIRKPSSAARAPRQRSDGVTIKLKTMFPDHDDGYAWLKYGEKTIKDETYNRSYYNCYKKECTVRKQTQRCSKDEDFFLFTYFGRHNHPANDVEQSESGTARKRDRKAATRKLG